MLDSQGYVMNWTAGAEQVKGFRADEVIGKHCSVFYTPEDIAADEPQKHLDRAKATGRDVVEGWRVRKDGTQFWAEVLTVALREPDGTLRGFAKVVRNATERKASQIALEQVAEDREAQIRAILDTAVDAIITINDRGRIESFNRSAQRMFGYKAKEVIGQNVKMLMPEPYGSEHDTYLSNYVRTGRAKIIGIGREVVALRKDGTTFPMDLAVSEVKLGTRRTFTGIIRDITDRKRLEKEILEISEREQRRIGQDLHDGLCQQLTGIAFLVQALQQKLAANARAESADAARVTFLLKEAVNQARSLSHGLYPVDPQPDGLTVALGLLAAGVSSLFNINCGFRCPRPVRIEDNSVATHLYRIAQEAVQNAIRHGKASRITIELNSRPETVRLCVVDNGVGFPDGDLLKPGMGLRTMGHRAHVIGGVLEIRRQARGGSRVVCELGARQLRSERT
jgi:two-component system sensor kinase FixL